jgi:chromosome segregation ATPase
MDVGDIVANPIAQLVFLVLSAAGGYRVWRAQQPTEAKERADSEGQIAALATWQALLEGERAARVKAEERADKFAAERNEALQQVWEMKGQLRAMNETIAGQTSELAQLREQVRQLKEQIHAQ